MLILQVVLRNVKIVNISSEKVKALKKIVLEHFESFQKINKKIPSEILNNIRSFQDPNKIADVIIANLNIDIAEKQKFLS